MRATLYLIVGFSLLLTACRPDAPEQVTGTPATMPTITPFALADGLSPSPFPTVTAAGRQLNAPSPNPTLPRASPTTAPQPFMTATPTPTVPTLPPPPATFTFTPAPSQDTAGAPAILSLTCSAYTCLTHEVCLTFSWQTQDAARVTLASGAFTAGVFVPGGWHYQDNLPAAGTAGFEPKIDNAVGQLCVADAAGNIVVCATCAPLGEN